MAELAVHELRAPNSLVPYPPILAGDAVGQFVADLTDALLRRDRHGALATLTRASERGWPLGEIEEQIIASAATRLGQLWQCRQLDDSGFRRSGAFLERIEWSFRTKLARRPRS